jgi:hypothetical protein
VATNRSPDSRTGTGHAVPMAIVRGIAHVTRPRARKAFVAGAACMAIYYWASGRSAETLQQFMLILTSVAAAAIILPELPSTLWTMDADRIRSLIPIRQREQLLVELIAAESDDQAWSKLVWSKAVGPLLGASREPWQYIEDMNYDIHIRPDSSFSWPNALETVVLTGVSVDSKSTRLLPPPAKTGGRYWISMARTEPSFQHEYAQDGCLARELTPMTMLTSTEWHDLIKQLCTARMIIDGEVIELTPEIVDELPDVVRWYASSTFEPSLSRVQVRIMFDMVMEAAVRSFTVSFRSYYCAGSTAITMRLDGPSAAGIVCENFFGRTLFDNIGSGVTQTRHAQFDEAVFSTGRDSILWPGSGVHFRWERTTTSRVGIIPDPHVRPVCGRTSRPIGPAAGFDLDRPRIAGRSRARQLVGPSPDDMGE